MLRLLILLSKSPEFLTYELLIVPKRSDNILTKDFYFNRSIEIDKQIDELNRDRMKKANIDKDRYIMECL